MSTSRRLLLLFAGAAWLGVRVWGATPAVVAGATPAVVAGATPPMAAVVTVLESSALRVEVTAAPYSYAVIEKATGQVLLRQAQTTFTVGTARSASTAPQAAAMPIAGAPRTASEWMAAATSSLVVQVRYSVTNGSLRWSSTSSACPVQRSGRIRS